MSQAIKCDRCGKYYEQSLTPRYLTQHAEVRKNAPVNRMDLCDECDDAFSRWMIFPIVKEADEVLRGGIENIIHGVNCKKVQHLGNGWLHAADFDGRYEIAKDRTQCGRCHQQLP